MFTRRTDRADITMGLRHRRLSTCAALARREGGAALAEFAVTLPFLALLLLGVIDLGRAYYLKIEVSDAAYAGALYGSRNTSDTTGMQSAATANAPDVPASMSFSATATNGCECSDGTNPVSPCPTTPPTCSVNVVTYVQVATSATYKPLFPWPGIPSSITLQGLARLRAGQ